jgi:type IV pilus assembly protein PilE
VSPRGTTLLELLVALALLATLATLALPGWRDAQIRARRSDAREALLHVRTLQERHYFTAGHYAATFQDLRNSSSSAAGHYGLSLETGEGGDSFIVRAAPVPGGRQANDADCREFWLDDRGMRGALGSADAPERCWR